MRNPAGLRLQIPPVFSGDDRSAPIAPGLVLPTRFTATLLFPREGVDIGDQVAMADEDNYEELVTLKIEVIDNVPRCIEMRLSPPDGSFLVSEDLRFPVQEWIDFVVSYAALRSEPTSDGGERLSPAVGDISDIVEATKTPRGRRRTMTPARLKRAADAYNAGGGIKGIQSVMGVGTAQAYRYRRQAIDAGLIEED